MTFLWPLSRLLFKDASQITANSPFSNVRLGKALRVLRLECKRGCLKVPLSKDFFHYERLSVNINQNRLFVAQVQNSILLIFCSLITLNE